MPRNLLQDMVKIKHKVARPENPEPEKKPVFFQEKFREPNKRNGGPRYAFWLVAAASVVFLFFALSYLFAKATVTVNPKAQDLSLNENLSADKDAGASALSFDLVEISGQESRMTLATGQKDVSQSAQGTVMIYNAFSVAAQPLDIATRLEGSNGKIYKTQTKTVIPGKNPDGTPGSVEVKISATAAGEDYNSLPLDFKILGFKGTSKYSKFYGRSEGAITGGLKGQFPSIGDSQAASVENELKNTLQEDLLKKATDQIPAGFILFKDAGFLNIDSSNVDFMAVKDNMLPVEIQGTFYGFLFDQNKLTQKIAGDSIANYDGSEVYIPNIKDLVFSLSSKDSPSFADAKSISFNLSGPAKIVWKIDTDKLTGDLLGKAKKDFTQILSQYPSIDSAQLSLSPLWRMSFPDKIKNIKVIVNYPK